MTAQKSKSDAKLREDRLELYAADLERIDACLDEFLRLSGARGEILIDRDGHVVTSRGRNHGFDLDTVAALVAGSFAATRQVARILGEEEFTALVHQGARESVVMQLSGDRALLTALFDSKTTLGMVKLYAAETAKRLHAIFEESCAAERPGDPAGPLGDDFGSQAAGKLDDLLK